MIDLHCHLLPGVDDGARDGDEAAWALQAVRREGVRRAVVTPHLRASVLRDPETGAGRMAALDAAWEELRARGREEAPEVRLARGAELRLDAGLPDLSDPRLRLGGSRAVLVEFQGWEPPPFGARQIADVAEGGWIPVLAHPERYWDASGGPGPLPAWRAAGAVFQVNLPSLAGRYGRDVRRSARALLDRGWADVLATDFHARGEVGVREGEEALTRAVGPERTRLLLYRNPLRLLLGMRPVTVPPVEEAPLWQRVRGWVSARPSGTGGSI